MIDRYARPAMKALWDEDAKYTSWADVERAHLQAMVDNQSAPANTVQAFDAALATKTPADFLKREQETNHDVIAFVAEVGDAMGDLGPYLHKGLTSSDVVDTSLFIRLQKSCDLITQDLDNLRCALTERAFEHAQTVCIGRTHGIHAEPMSFGQVLANHFAEVQRAHVLVLQAREQACYGKLSGAVGTYSQLTAKHEAAVLGKLGLKPEPVATQVIPRDRIVVVGNALLACAQAVERFCLNLRHWARTELGEVLEPFGAKQKGSSAMPHKKNPIFAENLCGLARAIRGYAQMLTENVALWHERDISHSSVERLAIPDMFVTLDFMLDRAAYLARHMEIRPQAMARNLWKTGGLWASQSVLTGLVSRGMNRTQAYEQVQAVALAISERVATGEVAEQEFLQSLLACPSIAAVIDADSLAALFQTERYLASVPVVFQRVFGIEPADYNRRHAESSGQKVPALQRVIKVVVELFPDVLDTEAKTIASDMRQVASDVLDVRQQRVFQIRMPSSASVQNAVDYAYSVLCNPVMEQLRTEVLQ